MKRGQRERWTPCDCTTTTRQARSVSARSLSVDSIFPLKNNAAKGRLPESSTSDDFTVRVPETENPIAEKLNLPVLPSHSSRRSVILSANCFFTSPRSALMRLSASSCERRCETAMLSFAILASCECTGYHESLVAGYWISIIPMPLRIVYMGLKVKRNRKSPYYRAFSRFLYWIKKFSSPKIKIWFEPMLFSGFFCGFERCGSAAFSNFRGGTSSPPAAAKTVRTNSRILHHIGNCKFERFAPLRSATNLYSILGVKTNSRFRILGEENFLILNP